MDPSNNQNSPNRQNFSLNFSDPPPYYPQNPLNPNIPPPNFSQHFSHHSPIYHNYPPPPGYDPAHGYHNPYFFPPQTFFPSNHSPNIGSPDVRPRSQDRLSSGRGSTNISADGNEDDVEVLVQPPPENDEPVNRRQWSTQEDEALISCFLQFSVDPIVGTNQSMPILWGKIHRAYKAIQQEKPRSMHPRNQESLRGRWRRLSSGISKWVGCYEQASRRRRSGMSEEDIVSEALAIYASDTSSKSKNFPFMSQWLKLKDQPRWESFLTPQSQQTSNRPDSGGTNSSGKRSRLDHEIDLNLDNLTTEWQEEESVPETQPQASSGASRPQGRQAAKKNKGKKKVVDEAADEEERRKERDHLAQIVENKKIIALEKTKQLEKNAELAYLQTFNNLVSLNRPLTPAEQISFKVICKKLGFDDSNI